MATQHFKRNLLLNLYREEKISLVCFPLPLERDKNVSHLQPLSSIWRPLAFLPVTLSVLVDPPLPSNTYNTHREQPHTYPTTDCGLHPVSGSQLPEPLKCPDWNGAKKVSLSLSLSDYHNKNLNVKFQKQNAMLCLLICSVVSDFLRPHGL